MKVYTALLITFLGFSHSAFAGSCYREASIFYSTDQATKICRGVGDACFDEVYQFTSLQSAGQTCRNVTSNSCYTQAFVFESPFGAADTCRGVDEDCFVDTVRFHSIWDAAKQCQ